MKAKDRNGKLYRRKVSVKEMDSVSYRRAKMGSTKDFNLLNRCQTLWTNMSYYREEFDRASMFTWGDQWGDLITVNGKTMTEREYIFSQGNVVLQTNQLRKIVDTITGVMIKERNEPVCNARDRREQQYGELLTDGLRANCNKNQMEILMDMSMKNLLVGGFAMVRESYEFRNGRDDSWTDLCDTHCAFMDTTMMDPRFGDLTLIGEFFDMSPQDLLAKFARSEEDYSILREIYANEFSLAAPTTIADFRERYKNDTMTFYTPEDRSKCRVFEVWTKETKPRYRVYDYNVGDIQIVDADDYVTLREIEQINQDRIKAAEAAGWNKDEASLIDKEFFIDTFWYCRFMAPDGTIIWEGESPYADRLHPYTIVITPFVGGRVTGYIKDAIDINRAINRTLILQDWLIRSQAKGVTVIPKELVPDDITYEEFADRWTSIGGLMYIENKPGTQMPVQFNGIGTSFNASELLNQLRKQLEDTTSVNGALQGKTPYAGTSGAAYAQMTANSSTPIASIMSQFRIFMEQLSTKKLKNMVKFYTLDRWQTISESARRIMNSDMDLNRIEDIEYDLNIKEGTETPVYRAVANDTLMQMFAAGAVSAEEVLRYGYFPFGDELLQARESQRMEEAKQQQALAEQGIPQQAVNPQAAMPQQELPQQGQKQMYPRYENGEVRYPGVE